MSKKINDKIPLGSWILCPLVD